MPAPRRRALAGAAAAAVRLALALVLLASSLGLAAAAPKFPALSGRIVDEANLLSAEDRRALEAELQALEEKSSDQLVIYTARSLQGYEIEDFGYQLGRAWQIGQKGQDNGIVLIVAPNERKVRIEVGRGLEPQLTDVMSKLIVENAILPAFRRGDFAAGIKAGVRDIRDVVLGDAEAVKARARAGAKREGGGSGLSPALLFLIFFIVMALVLVQADARQTAHPQRVGGRNRRASPGPIIIPGSWGGGSGSWGGSGGGGGFSGGGGSFGGGGASGSW
ncbi:MAG TPA: TPM domain-containing protein [Hyphomicrobiaceae bacterium]|nr:TPM domain-containing protein [Hyphomicrobiaceae bacterium]